MPGIGSLIVANGEVSVVSGPDKMPFYLILFAAANIRSDPHSIVTIDYERAQRLRVKGP